MLNKHFEVVALSSPGDDLALVSKREGVRTIQVPMKRDISIWHDLQSLFCLIIVFIHEQPDIVHANTPKGSLLSMFAGFLTFVPIRIYTITGLRYETEKGFKRKLLIWMERITCKFASHVIAESKGVQQMVFNDRLFSGKPRIIGNGNINGLDEYYWDLEKVNPDLKFSLKNKYTIKKDDFVFIFIGRLVGDKGINELVKAFRSFRDLNIKLLLVGPLESDLDHLEEDVLREIDSNPNIITTGFQADVRLFLSIAHSLILPSYREGFPNVLLQGGAMGLPLISTDVNGAIDLIIEGRNGLIIKKKSVEELEAAIKYMIANFKNFDPQVCREAVISRYSQNYYYPELLNFYKGL
jgi:glycosyltransferase involved in cell wall biosynthesis